MMDDSDKKVSPDQSERPYDENAADVTPVQSSVLNPTASATIGPDPAPSFLTQSQPFQSQAPMPPEPSRPQLTPKSSHKRRYIIGGVSGGVALLLIVAASSYFLWYQNPQKVIADALFHAVSAKQSTFTGSLQSGAATDRTDITYNGSIQDSKANINLSASFMDAGKKMSLPISLATDSKKFYVKIDDSSSISALLGSFLTASSGSTLTPAMQAQVQQSFSTVSNSIAGNWYVADPTQIGQATSSKVSSDCTANQISSLRTDHQTQSQLISIYRQHPLFTITKSLGGEDGSMGYQAEPVSDSQAKPFFVALSNSSFYKRLQKCDSSIKIDASQFTDTAKPTTTIELWISRWTHQFTKITLKDSSTGSPTTLQLMPKIGAKQSVNLPKNAKPITSILDGLGGSISGTSSEVGPTTGQVLAQSLINKIEAYNATNGQYPTVLTQVNSQLPDPSAVIGSLPTDGDHVAFKSCSATGGEVVYQDLAAGGYTALSFGDGPSGPVTKLCS